MDEDDIDGVVSGGLSNVVTDLLLSSEKSDGGNTSEWDVRGLGRLGDLRPGDVDRLMTPCVVATECERDMAGKAAGEKEGVTNGDTGAMMGNLDPDEEEDD